jgi:hypothetical protein
MNCSIPSKALSTCFGKTGNFDKRLAQIKLQLPYPVETVHVIKTNDETKLERYWHKRFAEKRSQNGESFLLTDTEVSEFKSRLTMSAPD